MDLDPRGMNTPAAQGRIVSVQMLRLIAASAVLFGHAELIAYHTGRFLGIDLVRQDWALKGAFGVDLFFVISGFIMVHSSQGLHGQPGAWQTFMKRRIFRIVPLYWAGTIVVLGWFAKFDPRPDLPSLLTSLAFIPYHSVTSAGRISPLLDVGWTLNYEMLFYTLFAATMAQRPEVTVKRLVGVLLAMVLLGSVVTLPLPLWYWARPIVLEFAAGMVLALLHMRGIKLGWSLRVLMLAFAALLVIVGQVDGGPSISGWGRVLTWGTAGGLVLAATILGPLQLHSERLWDRGGDLSYALYLVHIPLMLALQMLWRHFRWPYGPGIELGFIVLVCALSFVTAALAHDLFERPVTRWLQARVSRRR